MLRTIRFITIQNWQLKTFQYAVFQQPRPKYTPSSNRLNTGDKLITTSTLAVENAVFLVVEKISCFKMKNFRAFDTLTIYSNSFKIRVLIHKTLCRNARIQMDILKNNRFSAEETINYIPRTEKRKKVPVCEMIESFGSLSSPMLPILSWELKIIVYIPPSSKLELLCQYEMTS